MEVIFDDPDTQELFESYLIETNELLDNISQDLMLIESEPDNIDLINQIFRSFHTIKGTSSFMGFDEITAITHEAEDLLNKLRRSELDISQEIIDVLLDVHDWIHKLIDKILTKNDVVIDYSITMQQIKSLKEKKQVDQEVIENNKESIEEDVELVKPKKQTKKSKQEKQEISEKKSNEVNEEGFTEEELMMLQNAFNEINSNFSNEISLKNNTKKDDTSIIKEKNDLGNKLTVNENVDNKEKNGSHSKIQTETIRIEVHKIEALMDLSGELVLARNRLAQMAKQFSNDNTNKDKIKDLFETTSQIDFVTSEIQSSVMSMRMVQIGKLYQKAPRMVRDLSKEFNKQINLVVKGEETEIDRSIIEELNDPLVHMIRNSCDHGIESPESRIKNGKPPVGTITLDAEQEGNNIVITISDDGAGMDPEKLKAKAIEKGLITKEEANLMSDKESFQIIFMPGFSTAQKISNISGRGVGMDVVKTNIQKLKGYIEIDSKLNLGSTFIIKLPLTLAIIQGLLVKVRHETYAVPLSSVEEVVGIDQCVIKTINQQEVVTIRDRVCPILRLDQILKIQTNDEQNHTKKCVVIIRLGIERVGIVVDELLGQQEIVIKSIGDYLGQVFGIAGSTILGDGKVIMIIDIAEMIQFIQKNR